MPGQDKPIKCRRCQVAAEVVVANGQPQRVTCPHCGLTRDYGKVLEMLGEQAQAFATKKIQQAFARSFRKSRTSGVSFRHRAANIRQPKGDFFVELGD